MLGLKLILASIQEALKTELPTLSLQETKALDVKWNLTFEDFELSSRFKLPK